MDHRQRQTSAATLLVLSALLLAYAPVGAKLRKASDYFTICSRNDPNLSACIKRSIEEAKPQLIKGIPEIKMPPMDPLFIPAMELREGQGNFLFVLKMKNMTITGLKDFVLEDVKADTKKGIFNTKMRTPHLHLDADYEMEGRILALPIQGNGQCTMDFYGVSTIGDILLKNVTRGGKIHSQVMSFKWDINVEDSKSNFTNLFNGDKTLGDTTNRFLNENAKDAFETYKHLPEEAFGQFFRDVHNRFFEQFSVDELYPE